MTGVALRGLKGRLVNSSIDAYVLSLETINRLTVRYRVEAFNFLIINAWELLLKAKIIEDSGSTEEIFRPRKRGERRETHSISHCIRVVYPSEKNHVRENLEFVEEERHKATHLVLEVVPADLLSVYQACVVNFHSALTEWFGIDLRDRVSVGMMTLVFDLSPDSVDPSNAVLRRRIGTDAAVYLLTRQKEIARIQAESGFSKEFAAEIELTVSVVRNPSGADVNLSSGADGEQIGVLLSPKDSAKSHPYFSKMAAAAISKRISGAAKVNIYDVQCVAEAYGFARNSTMYFKSEMPDSRPQYSNSFIEWTAEQYLKDDQFFLKCRSKRLGAVTS